MTAVQTIHAQTITGFVRDSAGRPLAQADVSIEALSLRTTTDAGGHYVLGDIAPGMRLVRVRMLGHQPVATMLRIAEGESRRHDVVLDRVPQYLDTVVVHEKSHVAGVGLAAFEERQRLGFGKFFDSTFLRKNEHRRVQDFLRETPGMRVVSPPLCRGSAAGFCAPTTMRVAVSSRLGHDCFTQVILDGSPILGSSKGDWERAFDLNSILPSELAAIEVYRSAAEVPGEFNSAVAQCGVIVLWTKR
ncbi:MAG: carboxypeptidase regulatory-like domain-containing protein [Gemmatimonadaceae bacterium]